MASYVTIEKQYFETLLRRANCVSSSGFDTPTDVTTVTVLKSDHDDMTRKCREYENLKRALYEGGVDRSSIETLIKDTGNSQAVSTTSEVYPSNGRYRGSTQPTRTSEGSELGSRYTTKDKPRLLSGTHSYTAHSRQTNVHGESQSSIHTNTFDNTNNDDEDSFPSEDRVGSPIPRDGPSNRASSPTENRTVILKNVPDRATHRDITAAVRGGALVDVFLRSRDHWASVSFADPQAAQEFYTYAKRCNFCILERLVDVSWAERQYSLSTYISTQVTNGASRNLIIRGVHPNVTESLIREDMKHIHNLIIVSLTFSHGNAYISTNSVQKATFARNCMMSRMPYRIMRIEYYPDECADPLPRAREMPAKSAASRLTKPLNPMANRFQMLHLDESEEETDSSDDQESNSPLGNGISWRNNTIAV